MHPAAFDKFAILASGECSETEVAGRYSFQSEEEKKIIPDVASKLELTLQDTLLDIGSGPGNLLVPLLDMVKQAAAIDSGPVLERLQARLDKSKKIEYYPGNFLYMDLPRRKFSKIMIYSVMHYLESAEEVFLFLERAFSLLEPGGRLLVGDLPNIDKKKRFIESPKGQKMVQDWAQRIKKESARAQSILSEGQKCVTMDDAIIMRMLQFGREQGMESYLLPQPEGLPFCHTREDILFISHD